VTPQYTEGQRVRVRVGRGRDAFAADVIEMRGEKVRVRLVLGGATHVVRPDQIEEARPAYSLPEPREYVHIPTDPAHEKRIDAILAATRERQRNAARPVPKPPRAKWDRSYADFVRGHACQNCGTPPRSEHAHFGINHGGALKADDRRANALCGSDPATGREGCHAFWHRRGSLPIRTDAALVKMPRAESEALLYRWQVDLLIEWLDAKGMEPEEDVP